MFRKAELSDKKLFDEYFSLQYHMGSEACFSNLFAWQDGYNIEFDIINDMLCIRGKYKNEPLYYLMPYGNGDKTDTVKTIIEMAHRSGDKCVFKQLSEETAEFLDKKFSNTFSISHDRALDDYVYKTEKLISLSGKKLHAKRNHLNNFLKLYNHSFEALTPENCDAALCFALGRLADGDDTENEACSLSRLFGNFEALGLRGGVLKIENEIVAVTLGEMLNPDTAVIHVEKANTQYQGAYAAINQMFAKHSFGDTIYINREEDMGIEGLRKAKLSYYPELMVQKYMAVEK